jgi:hypothetical protein
MSKNDVRKMTPEDKLIWLCVKCIESFPFNHIIDNDLFIESIRHSDVKFGGLNCDELLFNPFHDDYGISNWSAASDKDHDPDLNHYNTQISQSLIHSNYYTYYELNQCLSNTNYNQHDYLSMFHCNIRSANKNANMLSSELRRINHQFDIIALSETWLNSNNTSISGFTDYNHIYNFRGNNRRGGGVSLLLKPHIKFTEMEEISISSNVIETIFVKIATSQRNIIVGCIYRPPNSNMNDFIDEYSNILKQIEDKNHVYLLGDFNIDLLKYNTHSSTSQFINMMFSSSFIPLINRPTRVTKTTATLIDNIYTNRFEGECLTGILPVDISDHFAIFHIHYDKNKYMPTTQASSKIFKRIINNQNLTNLKTMAQNANWSSVYSLTDPNTAYDEFHKIFNTILHKSMPLTVIKPKDNKIGAKPWLTKEILVAIQHKNDMYKRIRIKGDLSLEHEYKQVKNKLTNIIRRAEKDYYKSLLNKNKHNLTKMWKTLNFIIGRKKTKLSTTFKHNNLTLTDNQQIATHFNKYFSNVAKDSCNKIPATHLDPCTYMSTSVTNSLFFSPTNEEEIDNVIAKLKNSSPGFDEIEMKLIRHVKHDILSPLTHIFNQSFSMGIVPDHFKTAKVIPVYKTGDKANFSNYRPISILPAFSKILEKLAYKRIINYLDVNNILSESQYGFREGHSSDLAIQALSEKFYDIIDNDECMIGIFLDLSRAFDTLSHNILIRKLYYYGIRGTALDWVSNYLSGRKQFVSYNNSKSDTVDISLGIPQGSILGPLLFLLYVNDLCNISSKLYYILFADDSNMFVSGSSLSDMCEVLNRELDLVSDWLKANKLLLNIAKSSFMIMSSHHKTYDPVHYNICIDHVEIQQVNQCKFLGVTIDSHLSWNSHIQYISNKISKGIGILLRARQSLYIESLLTLYNSLIKPYFTYCITSWGNTTKGNMNKLYILQKKILRILTKSEFYAHTEPLYKKLKIMNICDLHQYFMGIFVYKSLNCLYPKPWNNLFKRNLNVRLSNNLRPAYYKHKTCQFSVKYMGPKIWNSFCHNVKTAKSIYIFKRQFKKLLL